MPTPITQAAREAAEKIVADYEFHRINENDVGGLAKRLQPFFDQALTEQRKLAWQSAQQHIADQKVIEALRHENAVMTTQVGVCKRAVAKLWKAVADGHYDARSIVGDETLSMKEVLFGNEWPPQEKPQ